MRVFGVGSVFFGYSDDAFEMSKFDLVVFKSDIVAALEGLENVSNVTTINADGRNVGFRSFEENQDGELVIIPCSFSVSLDLFMPRRIQANYGAELEVETFSIDIVYGYDRPVLYCSYDTDDVEDRNQQFAVIVVRKFLQNKLDGKIYCRTIAPSPFHANFLVSIGSGSVALRDLKGKKSGIGEIEITVPNDLAPMDQVIEHLNPTLSRFYYLSSIRSKLIDERTEILNGISALLDGTNKGRWQRLKSHFTMRNDIDTLQSRIIGEKISRIEAENYLAEGAGDDELGDSTPLSPYFDEYREMAAQSAWSDFVDVARFFEDRRHRVFGNVSTVIAGLIGGIIGAIIGGAATLYAASLPKEKAPTVVDQPASPSPAVSSQPRRP